MKLAELAESQHGVVARYQARALGVTRSFLAWEVAAGRWEALSPRVLRRVGAPRTDRQRVMAGTLDAGASAVASHTSAAWLWGIPGFSATDVHVSRDRGARSPSRLAVVHRPLLLTAHHRTVVGGIPVTTCERTLCDVASMVRPQRLARAVDSALARNAAALAALWLTFGDLTARGRPGRTAMTAVLADRRPGYVAPESELEARFLDVVSAAGLEPPERQVDLGLDDWIGRVDFFYRRAGIVIEVDGRLGHSSLLDREADARRDARMRAAGVEVLRFGWDDVVLHPHRMVRQLRPLAA